MVNKELNIPFIFNYINFLLNFNYIKFIYFILFSNIKFNYINKYI